jgi:hypothetical protein
MLGNKQNNDKILFRGSSCFPISPAEADEDEQGNSKVKQIDSKDQLIKILTTLGEHQKLAKESFDRKEMHQFYSQCKMYCESKPYVTLDSIHEGVDPVYIDFLNLCL